MVSHVHILLRCRAFGSPFVPSIYTSRLTVQHVIIEDHHKKSPEFDDYTGLVGIHSVCCSMSTCARRFDLASERAANERREQRQGDSVESSKTGSLKCDIA